MKAVYFSPNDTTRRVTEAAAAAMEPGGERVDLLKAPLTEDVSVGAEEMLVVGMPVYAGRIPALCLSSLAHLKGNGGPAAAIAVYGNRDYDDALLDAVRAGSVLLGRALLGGASLGNPLLQLLGETALCEALFAGGWRCLCLAEARWAKKGREKAGPAQAGPADGKRDFIGQGRRRRQPRRRKPGRCSPPR